MAHFKSAEELLALRPKPNRRQTVDNSTREDLSQTDLRPKVFCNLELDHKAKGYKFKRVKNSSCGWEVDYLDQKEDIPGQLDLTEEEERRIFLEQIKNLPINQALTRDYQRSKKEEE